MLVVIEETPGRPMLHLLCGYPAAGKSALAVLYPREFRTMADFVERSDRLRKVLTSHLPDLLRAGVSVVLDFPVGTPRQRAWIRRVIDATGVAHRLHYLDVPTEVCWERLQARNSGGQHPFNTGATAFALFVKTFVPPRDDEGFNVVTHRHGVDGWSVEDAGRNALN